MHDTLNGKSIAHIDVGGNNMTMQEAANLLKDRGGKIHLAKNEKERADFQEAWKSFDSIANIVPSELKLIAKHSWQNSGKITDYAWLMFGVEPYINVLKGKEAEPILPLTLSFFVNPINEDGDYAIRVCLELNHGSTTVEQINKYYGLLSSITPPSNLISYHENAATRLSDKQIPFSGSTFKKTYSNKKDMDYYSVGYTLPLLDDETTKKQVHDAFEKLLPLYKEIMEKCDEREIAKQTKQFKTPGADQNTVSHEDPVFPKNLIFYGAPGTGKTYKTVNHAVAICLKKPLSEINVMPREELTKTYRDLMERGNISFVTFHQSYSYEDFVIGIFPELTSGKDNQSNGIRYIRKDGIFKVLCDTARNHKDTNFVLIIDEINRGNISKIFGELITLIEDSKREGEKEETSVLLPYLDNENIIHFSVPSNVYIIGTMNTADRSIQHVDTALRRRFVFEEMLPDSGLFKDVDIHVADKSLNVATLLDFINRRIKRYFDREHVIGHAYFMPLKQEGLSEEEKLRILGDIFHDRIIPLLQDYFFEDYSKIQKVLGESEDTLDEESLIRKAQEDIVDDEDDGRDVYEVAPKGDAAYTNIDTYLLMAK